MAYAGRVVEPVTRNPLSLSLFNYALPQWPTLTLNAHP